MKHCYVKNVFKEYMRVREILDPYPDPEDDAPFIVWDTVFDVWGNGGTEAGALEDLELSLEEHFDVVMSLPSDVIEREMELALCVIGRRKYPRCQQATAL